MRYFIFSAAAALFANVAIAQDIEGFFSDYDAYSEFVDRNIMDREFIALLNRLGGSDEYTPEEMVATDRQLKGVWSADFDGAAVFNKKDLGGGIYQEARAYWSNLSPNYAYFYALLHERDGQLVVLQFYLNSSSSAVLDKF